MRAEGKRKAVLSSQQVCGACGQFIPKKELDENGLFHSFKFCQIAIEEELNNRLCQLCGKDIGDITKGANVLPWGATCGICLDLINGTKKDNKTTQQKREEIHLSMLEDFGNVIVKHLPNFDNNLEDKTWKLLELFTEEAIYQLTEKENN